MSEHGSPSSLSNEASEFSYGIIPIRLIPGQPDGARANASNTQVLLILQRTSRAELNEYYTFPKGHVEAQDIGPLDTARRELLEETGLKLREENFLFRKSMNSVSDGAVKEDCLVRGDGFTDEEKNQGAWVSRYINPDEGHIKEVRYWVGLVDGDTSKLVPLSEEVGAAEWYGWDEAEAVAAFEETKLKLREARAALPVDGLRV